MYTDKNERNKKACEKYNKHYNDLGIARHKLNRQILHSLIKETGKDTCYRCQEKIIFAEEVSVDHIKPWLHEENAYELFFDLNNIAFSHKKCNSKFFRFSKTVLSNTGYRGVTKVKRKSAKRQKDYFYVAKITDKKTRHIGVFKTPEEAAKAYDKEAINVFGEKAIPILNFPNFDYTNYKSNPVTFKRKYKYVGVFYENGRQKWVAYAFYNKKTNRLGRYETEIEAAKQYDKHVIENNLNLPLNFPVGEHDE